MIRGAVVAHAAEPRRVEGVEDQGDAAAPAVGDEADDGQREQPTHRVHRAHQRTAPLVAGQAELGNRNKRVDCLEMNMLMFKELHSKLFISGFWKVHRNGNVYY